MSDLGAVVRGIMTGRGPVTVNELFTLVLGEGISTSMEDVAAVLAMGRAQGEFEVSVERHAGALSAGYPCWRMKGQEPAPGQCREPVLVWGKPPQAEAYEDWAAYQADSAPHGTYQPNMPDDWKRTWKAKMTGQRGRYLAVEVRKSVQVRHAGSVQVKIVVHEGGDVLMSMNGVAGFSPVAWAELNQAVTEAHAAMAMYRKAHPAPLPPRDDQGRRLCHYCNKGYVWDLRRRCDQCAPRPAEEPAAT